MPLNPYETVGVARWHMTRSAVWGGFVKNCIGVAHEARQVPDGAWPTASLVVGAVECHALGWLPPSPTLAQAVVDYAKHGGRRSTIYGFHAWLNDPVVGLIDCALSSCLGAAEDTAHGRTIGGYTFITAQDAMLLNLVYHPILTSPADTVAFYEHVKSDMIAHPGG